MGLGFKFRVATGHYVNTTENRADQSLRILWIIIPIATVVSVVGVVHKLEHCFQNLQGHEQLQEIWRGLHGCLGFLD